jgi:hypothetical protein
MLEIVGPFRIVYLKKYSVIVTYLKSLNDDGLGRRNGSTVLEKARGRTGTENCRL